MLIAVGRTYRTSNKNKQKIMLTLVQNKIKKMFEPSLKIRIMPLKKQIELGTDYAGYVIPEYLLNRNTVYYSVGAGEDISLDIEIANRYNPVIHIFDPTPRSKTHFEITKENALNDKPNIISKKYQYPTTPKTFLKTVFEEICVWNALNLFPSFKILKTLSLHFVNSIVHGAKIKFILLARTFSMCCSIRC